MIVKTKTHTVLYSWTNSTNKKCVFLNSKASVLDFLSNFEGMLSGYYMQWYIDSNLQPHISLLPVFKRLKCKLNKYVELYIGMSDKILLFHPISFFCIMKRHLLDAKCKYCKRGIKIYFCQIPREITKTLENF